MIVAHLEAIYWENGQGETPCSVEYKAKYDERESLIDKVREGDTFNPSDFSPEDYNTYHQIENDLGVLQINGHLGKGERY